MHRKYGSQGVVCLSVSVDQPTMRDKALGFLKEQQADFPNYWLNEEAPVWQERFNINGPPAVFVFDRDGRRAGKFDTSDPDKPYTYADVEALVKELLKAKP
jgi:hypothetical protein